MPEDITKLPKWAQRKILLLERQVDSLGHRLKQWEGEEETNVVYLDGINSEYPLPKDKTIRFYNDNEWIDVRVKGGGIHVMGQRRLAIFPQMTNVVDIYNFKEH